MNYALGCAFSTKDLFMNFPYKKLKITCKECESIIGDNHKQILVSKVFRYSVKLILYDIVNRNVTFWLPLTGAKKCNIHMKRVQGRDFQNLRKAGKWKDVDIVASNFSGYELGLYMFGNRTPRIKTVYVDKYLRKIITENTNKGKQYGDGCIDTTINDYIADVCQKFEGVSKQDIKRILVFAWKSVYLHNSYGGDLLISDKSLWCYFGNLKKSALQHYTYYIKKLIIKIRIMYKKKKIPWDGYYYFALSDEQYQNYLSQIKSTGRPKKTFNFGDVFIYEILDECKLKESSRKYIFRMSSISKIKMKYLVRNLKTNAELIEIRQPLKFKDIIVNDNKYEVL